MRFLDLLSTLLCMLFYCALSFGLLPNKILFVRQFSNKMPFVFLYKTSTLDNQLQLKQNNINVTTKSLYAGNIYE